MDIIKSEKIIINELVKIYSEKGFLDDLKITAESISNHFKNLLDDLGEKNDLISKNSIRELKYFSLIFRVKEPDSLKEKFYRGNLLQEDFKNMSFISGPDVIRQRNNVKLVFKKCDDLIGVKILTDLNEDCKKVISILKNNEEFLKKQGIILDKNDLAAQPVPMKNGLDIYKIKGELNSIYSFELQIKSKIQSVWGDMEHSIFYKDYFISPVRDSTQATMNHIGKMLYQIDEFLLSVRNANKNFKSNSKFTEFLTWFDDTYTSKIFNSLGVGYKIDTISEALAFIKSKINTIKIRDLQFNHFKYKSTIDLYKKYISIRNNSYDLKIFESVVFSWLWDEVEITKVDINQKFEIYFELIYDYIVSEVYSKFEGEDVQDIKIMIQKYFNEVLKYNPKSGIILSPNDYIKHLNFLSFIKSELELNGDEDIEENYKNLDLIFINMRFKGNFINQIEDLKFTPYNIQKYREILGNISNSIKIKEKKMFEKELSLIDSLIKSLK